MSNPEPVMSNARCPLPVPARSTKKAPSLMSRVRSRAPLAVALLFAIACSSSAESPTDLGVAGADAGRAGASMGNAQSGAGTGGAHTAGANSGGANSGGANSGGANSGGAAHVGGASAGGTNSGGAHSGGASAGGANSGGAHSGGGSTGGAAGNPAAAGAAGVAGGALGAGGAGGVVFPAKCTCLGLGPPQCMPTGNVTFTLARAASPTADEQRAYDDITCAMDGAVAYYNCNTTISKQLNVTYVPSVATADGNISGSIRFGSDHSYMECATGMHEIAHAVGVGTAPKWPQVSTNGLFNGANAIAQLRAITGVATDVLHSDTQHFWPYGLNYASEAKSTADLIDHCLMVTAIRKDLGL